MAHPEFADLGALIGALAAADLEFILVGGAAAVAHGAPTATYDVDIVHRRTADNVERLAKLLVELDAYIREPGPRRLRPSVADLTEARQLLLRTRLGPLDLLGALHDGRDFAALMPHTEVGPFAGHALRILDVPTLIEVKASTGRAKDQRVVAELLVVLEERERRAG